MSLAFYRRKINSLERKKLVIEDRIKYYQEKIEDYKEYKKEWDSKNKKFHQPKCNDEHCAGHYEFSHINDEGWEIWKCTKCGDIQTPESI